MYNLTRSIHEENPMLNTIILGKYEIKKQVRENDLFVEYWGRDTQTNRDVTVIAIHTRLVSAANFFSRFEPAVKKIANLKSNHTAAWIDSGEAEGHAVIIREYVDGLSLSGMLAAGENGLPLDLVLDIAHQLGEYLEIVHQSGSAQVFFDLEDVFLSAGSPVQVTNFGIPQGLNIGDLLSANKIQARSFYPPELLKGVQTDLRADFYSLGAVLFQALTGKELNPDFESADKTLMAEFFPSRLRMGIPMEWDVLVAKCLHPNPAKRIQSAAEFLSQLDELRGAMTAASPGHPLSMEDSLVGQTLGGYRLVSRQGQGGMATVYKAYEPALDRYVAIKVLPQFFAKDPIFVQRFKREAKAVAQLNHPNIVPIYSYGESGGITYIAMQFVVGDTLKHDGQKFGFEESLRLLSPIARALGYAHQRGVVHRDIKPSNILIAEDGNWPLLADFGLAQMAQVSGKLTESGVGMGTPMYMSPEQGQGEKVDHRTDIYSLGIVLYEMVTGDVPFRADTPMAIVIKHISAPMPMPRQVNPNVPDYLEAIILKATAKNPDHRYQTAEEMALALENALSRLSSSAPVTRSSPAPEIPPAPTFVPPASIPQPAPERKSAPEVKAETTHPSAVVVILQGIGSFFRGIFKFVAFLIILALLLPILVIGGAAALDICPPQGPWPQLPWCEGTPYPFTIDGTTPKATLTPVATEAPASTPVAPVGMILDDFENESPKGRSDWESYFQDNADTQIDCHVDNSHDLRDSNYLNFKFDVAEDSWATCGFYFDSTQDWSAGKGVAFYLRSDQPNAEYQIELFGGTPDALTTYVYWTATPPGSVNGWARIEIPWEKILRADWEENPGTVFDPAIVNGFLIAISSDVGVRQSGTLWMDDLSLFGAPPAASTQESNLFLDNFDNLNRTDLESYFLEGSDTKTACSLDETIMYEGVASLKFNFDAAPDAWASCEPSFFDNVQDWSAGQGIAFYVHAEQADMPYEVNLFGALGSDETYPHELTTTLESVDGWQRVEIYWKDILRADWEENAGAPVNPASIMGFSFGISAPKQARLSGTLWFDDFQVIP
jgi:serine/threonine-protein kinase